MLIENFSRAAREVSHRNFNRSHMELFKIYGPDLILLASVGTVSRDLGEIFSLSPPPYLFITNYHSHHRLFFSASRKCEINVELGYFFT